jgi:formylglycine-generating enzyme required for sulfatase activity
MEGQPIEVFFSYSREDKPLRDKLEKHLVSLKRQGVISLWHDREIVAGSEWEEEIDRHLKTADIILLLISPDFVASKYCYEVELPDAIARHEAAEAYVVPILLRPTAGWKNLSFAKLQVYPSGGKAVTLWGNEDEAFVDVAEGIAIAVAQLLERREQKRQNQKRQEQERLPWEQEHLSPKQEQEQRRIAEIRRQEAEAAQRAKHTRLAEQARTRELEQQIDEEKPNQPECASSSAKDGQPMWFEVKTFEFEVAIVNAKGQEYPRQLKQAQAFVEDLGNGVMLEMVQIPEGTFLMGSLKSEKGRSRNESPLHSVNCAQFFMGRYAITQAQYQAIMGKNPSRFKGANRPVEKVSWWNVQEFCTKLSGKTGRTYRLPSEAEWEYACRAGTTTPFHFGETITTNLANYNGKFTYQLEPKGKHREQTTDVGSFPANAFGLCDMHGNVWEWCGDVYHKNYEGAPADGKAWMVCGEEISRLLRGGSYGSDNSGCRSATRARCVYSLTTGYSFHGFRIVCSAPRTP